METMELKFQRHGYPWSGNTTTGKSWDLFSYAARIWNAPITDAANQRITASIMLCKVNQLIKWPEEDKQYAGEISPSTPQWWHNETLQLILVYFFVIVTFFTFPQGLITSNSKQHNLLLFNTVKGVAGLVSERQQKIMSKDEKVAQSHYPSLLVINFEEFMKWQITYVECFILAVRVVKKVMVLKNRWCFSWWKTLLSHKWLIIFTLWYDRVLISEVVMIVTSKIETPIIIIVSTNYLPNLWLCNHLIYCVFCL